MTKSLIIVGGGGQCKVILDCLRTGVYDQIFIEDPFVNSSTLYGITVIKKAEVLDSKNLEFVVAIGDNYLRSKIVSELETRFPEITFATIIHPTAYVAETAKLGAGIVVCPGSIIGAYSSIGNHVIINTNSSVDHDCRLGNFSSIGPNATLGGNVRIGKLSVVAISATVVQGINIADFVIVGACALVLYNINDELSLWLGCPATKKRERTINEKYL
jgi:sugar O-acyltransferase (sialic acid O-acetyltransferase NeuD family)